ncbi:MAG TPA: hypothetical protein PK264_01770, partial [Hyphomicrobiaceae bacterium]|nr:hypothetical protein [Hyphomicrobiaceae bacterium]
MNDATSVAAEDQYVTHAELAPEEGQPNALDNHRLHELILRLQSENRHLAAITVRGWSITNPIELGLHGTRGLPLPRLSFVSCSNLKLSARFARLNALSLNACAIEQLDLTDAVIDGPLDLEHSTITGEHDTTLALTGIKAQSILITRLSRSDENFYLSIDLGAARIERGLVIDAVRLKGPLMLDRTSLGADATITGSRFERRMGAAVSARALVTGGPLSFSSCQADGAVNLADARIGGDLSFDHVEIRSTPSESVLLADTTVQGTVRVANSTCTGTIQLRMCAISGSVAVEHTTCNPLLGAAISILGGKIGAEITLVGLKLSAQLEVRSVGIGLNMVLDDVAITGDERFPINLLLNRIGGGLDIIKLRYAGYGTLRACSIGASLYLEEITLNPRRIEDQRSLYDCNLLATENVVGGKLTLGTIASEGEDARGLVDLRNTRCASFGFLGHADSENIHINLNGLDYGKIDQLNLASAKFLRAMVDRNERRRYE